MYGTDRTTLRRVFTTAWAKYRNQTPLDPLENLIANIIKQHPEFHDLLENENSAVETYPSDTDWQDNPFLHLSLHMAVHEQISTNRPVGLADLYHQLTQHTATIHDAQHQLMICLAEQLWLAQTQHRPADEQAYLECVKTLITN